MKKLLTGIALSALLVACAATAQTPTPATFNTPPSASASFWSQLTTFLFHEEADRYETGFADYRIANCDHPTAADDVGVFPGACEAIISGQYIYDDTASIDYGALGAGNEVLWVALHKDTTTSMTGNWERLAGTHYIVEIGTGGTTRPTRLADSMFIMTLTISGGAITSVDNIYNVWPGMETYNNASEIDDTRAGQWWYSSLLNIPCWTNGTTCSLLATADGSGCATCGDSAVNFFGTGQLGADDGGTGTDSSAEDGVPTLDSGTWTYEDPLEVDKGGTGLDTSSSTGYWHLASGTPTIRTFPNWVERLRPGEIGVDGQAATGCTMDPDQINETLASGVVGPAIVCKDNDLAVMAFTTSLPFGYTAASDISIAIWGTNDNGSADGDVVWKTKCGCLTKEGTLSSAIYSTQSDITLTFVDTAGDTQRESVTITCGGSCAASDALYVQMEIDAGLTTYGEDPPASGTLEDDVRWTLVEVFAGTDYITH